MPGVWAENECEGVTVQPRQVLHGAGEGGTARGHTNPEAKNKERRTSKRADKPTGKEPEAQAQAEAPANEKLQRTRNGNRSKAANATPTNPGDSILISHPNETKNGTKTSKVPSHDVTRILKQKKKIKKIKKEGSTEAVTYTQLKQQTNQTKFPGLSIFLKL